MSEKGLELLAPAGDIQILKAVIDNGADAVYFAGEMFGARAYAKNFSKEDAKIAIEYAHLFNKKVYLTVNTLIKNIEFQKDLYEYLKYYYELGIDAFIVQDIGLIKFIKENFPKCELHISTQISTSNSYGATFFKNLGAERIVLSRELSLKEIKNIYDKTHMDIEVFVHGAICICYSGNCLMSSFFGGRSGNRGRCAQPCRLPYMVNNTNHKLKKNEKPLGSYLISPSDMCLIDMIKELSEAGAYSLKIEGRMKSLSYAAGVVSIYRKYIDMYLEKRESYIVSKEDMETLKLLGERGSFTKTYLTHHNGKELMTFKDSSFHNAKDVDIKLKERSTIPINIKAALKKGFPLKIVIEEIGNNGGTIKESTFYGDTVEKAKNRPLLEDNIKEKLLKINDTYFSASNIEIDMEEDIFIPISSINKLRRDALLSVEQSILKEKEKTLLKERLPKNEEDIDIHFNTSVKNKEMQKLRYMIIVLTKEQLDTVLKYKKYIDTIILDYTFLTLPYDFFSKLKSKIIELKLCLRMPDVFRQNGDFYFTKTDFSKKKELFDMFLATSYDSIGFLEENGIENKSIILDHRLYTYNNEAVAFFNKNDFLYDTIPLELNYKEISHRNNKNSIMICYGRAPLMIMANCTKKNLYGCNHKTSVLEIKDRKNICFPIRNECQICMNTIYNSLPTDLFSNIKDIKKVGCDKVRIDFTVEDESQTDEVLKEYFNLKNIDIKATKGHFNRGVI